MRCVSAAGVSPTPPQAGPGLQRSGPFDSPPNFTPPSRSSFTRILSSVVQFVSLKPCSVLTSRWHLTLSTRFLSRSLNPLEEGSPPCGALLASFPLPLLFALPCSRSAGRCPITGQVLPETGYSITNDKIVDYYDHRGGSRVFGPPSPRSSCSWGAGSSSSSGPFFSCSKNGNVGLINLLSDDMLPYTHQRIHLPGCGSGDAKCRPLRCGPRLCFQGHGFHQVLRSRQLGGNADQLLLHHGEHRELQRGVPQRWGGCRSDAANQPRDLGPADQQAHLRSVEP